MNSGSFFAVNGVSSDGIIRRRLNLLHGWVELIGVIVRPSCCNGDIELLSIDMGIESYRKDYFLKIRVSKEVS
jgi:hypothetical protein